MSVKGEWDKLGESDYSVRLRDEISGKMKSSAKIAAGSIWHIGRSLRSLEIELTERLTKEQFMSDDPEKTMVAYMCLSSIQYEIEKLDKVDFSQDFGGFFDESDKNAMDTEAANTRSALVRVADAMDGACDRIRQGIQDEYKSGIKSTEDYVHGVMSPVLGNVPRGSLSDAYAAFAEALPPQARENLDNRVEEQVIKVNVTKAVQEQRLDKLKDDVGEMLSRISVALDNALRKSSLSSVPEEKIELNY